MYVVYIVYIAFIHMKCFLTFPRGIAIYKKDSKCFLTFQYEITIYTVFTHIKYFLTFSRGITIYIYIYNLHSYGLFLDFSLWNTHTHTTYT